MDPASIVEDTQWTGFGQQMDGQTDRQWERQMEIVETNILPLNFVGGGIKIGKGFTAAWHLIKQKWFDIMIQL